MATAKSRSSRLRRRLWLAAFVIALLVIAWVVWGDGLRRTGAAGTAYGARVACSCVYVAGRSLDDCAKDKLEGMELVHLSEDRETKSVTASIPLVARDTASFRDGYGCVLQEWSR